jgi:serine phosphatase RsbU (regulator of sigma subunit)
MKKIFTLYIICFFITPYFLLAKKNHVVSDTISIRNFKSGLSLDDLWKYKIGDEKEWSESDYDDSGWRKIIADSTDDDTLLNSLKGVAWFRSSFYIDSTIGGFPLALQMRTNGACDVFIDGKLIRSLGVVGKTEKEQVSGFSLREKIIPVPASTTGRHFIAIRTSNYSNEKNFGLINIKPGLVISNFDAEIGSMQKALGDEEDISAMTIPIFFCGVFIVLSIFHLVLFLYYRKNRSNLYYSFFNFFIFIIFFSTYRVIAGTDLETTKTVFTLGFWSLMLVPLFFIGVLYEVFYKKLFKFFWILSGLYVAAVISLVGFEVGSAGSIFLMVYLTGGLFETIRIFIRAWIKKREGSRVFMFGMFFPVFGVIAISFISMILRKSGFTEAAESLSDIKIEFFLYSLLMSVSISMTIYLARDFARMNKKLHDQIGEIKHLFNRTIEQENERKKILENQKEDLEKMVTVRTEEVLKQKAVIEAKNRDILDNLLYARRIQDAILPEIGLIYETLKESFIIYIPKDIVSGDFYSFSQRDGKVILAAADCTGHGVTGAFMSMIGSSVLNQIINERGITQPSSILNYLNSGITEALRQRENDVNDGMDIALCTFDLKTQYVQYAGANRPLWIFRNQELMEIKPDKMAIGGFRIINDASFTNHEFKLQSGDSIYLFTDGFADQFGGPDGKKLLTKRLREILISIQNLSMREQEKKLLEFFNEWKGDSIQVDDVLMIGVRV